MKRLALIFLAAGACLALGLWASSLLTPRSPAATSGRAAVGGPFQLVDQNGRTFSDKDLRGRPAAIFFGFTACPEVCPTTLLEMGAWLEALGRDADRLQPVFISVDPERDTPERMKAYLSAFDPRIQGLTGSPEAVAATAKAYRVYARKVPLEGGGYTVDHTATVFLFDERGGFVDAVSFGGDKAEAVAKLKGLVR